MPLGDSLHFLNPEFLSEEERLKRIEIDDIPFMLSSRREIVCIPKSEETFAAAITGSSGTGKTLLLNRLCQHLYYLWKCNVAIMNDVSEETYWWSESMKDKKFNQFNKSLLQQEPSPSPLVYLYPNTKDLVIPKRKKDIDGEFKIIQKITLPFREILDDLGFYLSGISPAFDLGKSAMYIDNIKESLIECETPNEVKNTLNEQLPGMDGKTFQGMRVKIMNAFDLLFKEQILDITNPEYPSYIQADNFISDPFSALMKAKMIPSFVTSDLSTKTYKSEIFSYYVNKIFRNNLKNFGGEKTFLLFDELTAVCDREDDIATKAIGGVAVRGRINHVGLIYCTQFYNKIPNLIKGAKLNYCFVFQLKNNEAVSEIGRDFDLGTKTREAITNLDKNKFEMIAITNNKFICYNEYGDRYETDVPIKGVLIPPMADNKRAGK